jgi:D-aminoacyl-tRNA deacylase
MRAVVQRVSSAHVVVDGREVGRIGQGILVLIGVAEGDEAADAATLADKVVNLRIFDDDEGKMNRSLLDVGGGLLAVSQFTLLGDCRKGRRPSFVAAAAPELGKKLYERFVEEAARFKIPIALGQFRAHMQVHLVNDGPVTILLDTKKEF